MNTDIQPVRRYDPKAHLELVALRGKQVEAVDELSSKIRDIFTDTDRTDASDAEHARLVMQHTAECRDLERMDRELQRMELAAPSDPQERNAPDAFARWAKGGVQALGADEAKRHTVVAPALHADALPDIAGEVGITPGNAELMLEGIKIPGNVTHVEWFIEPTPQAFSMDGRQGPWARPMATVRTDESPGGEDWTSVPLAPTWMLGESLKLISGLNGRTSELRTSHGLKMRHPTVDDTSEEGEWFDNQGSSATDGDYTPDNVEVGTQIHSSKKINQSLAAEADAAQLARTARTNMDRRHARALERAIVAGAGANDTPRGVLTDATRGKLSGSKTAVVADDLLEMIDSVDIGYMAGEGSPQGLNPPMGMVHRGFAFNQNTLSHVRRAKGTDGHYLWRPGLAGLQYADPPTISGYPFVISNYFPDVAANAMIAAFGNFGYWLKRTAGARIIARFFDSGTAGNYSVQYISFIRCGGRFVGGFVDVAVAVPKTEAVKFLQSAA